MPTGDAGGAVRVEPQPGWYQTLPAGGAGLPFSLTDSSPAQAGLDFGTDTGQTGSVQGSVFRDNNDNGWREWDEPGVAGWRVYSDANGNGQWDPGEPQADTDAGGSYALPGLALYASNPVRLDAPAGWHGACGLVTYLFLSPDSASASGIDFAAAPDRCGVATGTVYEDADAGGTREGAEAGLEGWLVYSDENGDGALDNNEPNATTASDGTYSLSGLRFDTTEAIRVTPQPGWTQTAPGCGGIYWAWTTSCGPTACGLDFGMNPIVLGAITATDSGTTTNAATAADAASPDLYVAENAAGSAAVNLSASFTSVDSSAGQKVLWTVSGDAAAPAAGDFSGSPTITLTPADGNYDFPVTAGVDVNGNGMLDYGEVTRTINVHLYSAELKFNDSAGSDDDVVQLSTPSYGPDIPANQPVLDTAVRVIGSPPPGLAVSLDNPDGRLAFGAAAPSPSPAPAPSSPIPTVSTTSPFTLTVGGGWMHLPVVGIDKSTNVGDGSVRVIVSGGGGAAGAILVQKAATVFWFGQATMNVVPDATYALQGQNYKPAAPPAGLAPHNAVDMVAAATIQPATINTNAPQLKNLRIVIVQNVTSDSLADVYDKPQVTWRTNYPSGNPVPVGTAVDIPDTVSRGHNVVLNGATFPLPDAKPDEPNNPLPLYSRAAEALVEPMGYTNGDQAGSSDSPNLPAPASPLPPGILGVNTLVVDNVGVAATALYKHYVKSTRTTTFTTWCVLVDTTAGVRVVAPLAQTEWQIDLNSTGANEMATAGQSHAPNALPVLSGDTANSFGRIDDGAVPYGPGTVHVVK